jgi:hypothetical protein
MQTADAFRRPVETSSDFVLQVGNLSSISSLHHAIGERLVEYNRIYLTGQRPAVSFDLTSIQPRKVSMSALTALLATMGRFREFSETPAGIELRWNPEVFGFLDDIGFFELGQELDLFCLQPGIQGGYTSKATNPSTQILYSKFEDAWSSDPREQAAQKDDIRNSVKESLLMLCGELFRPRRGTRAIPSTLRDQVLVTSAELVVNCHLWGRANAFIGLQRTSRGITVCVCDSGEGFLSSLRKKRKQKLGAPTSHLESLGLGCVVNNEDFGLRRAIDMVTRFDGRVEISSYSAEIVWRSPIWNYWVSVATDPSTRSLTLEEKFRQMRTEFAAKAAGPAQRQTGYCRDWPTPLRGSRVTFEIPIQEA